MRNGLPQGQHVVHRTSQAHKQAQHGLIGGAGLLLGQKMAQHVELLRMVFAQLLRARMQPPKHPLMGGQDQRIRRQPLQAAQGVQPQLQRIGLGLDAGDQHVGADARQQLVAGNQDSVLLTIQAGMFRRVPFTNHHTPLPRAQLQAVTPTQTGERQGLG